MSTPCRIGVMNTDGTVNSIYCHHDGSPSYMKPLLTQRYSSYTEAKELVNLGDISFLAANIAPPDGVEHSFDKPAQNVTVAYHRDRAESWDETQYIAHTNIDEYINYLAKSSVDYAYLYDPIAEHWGILSRDGERFLTLGLVNNDMKNIKRVFISQPMRDLSDKEIKTRRENAIKEFERFSKGEPYEIIESFFEGAPHNAKPLWFLSQSLGLLSTADYALFLDGWETARDCRIENTCAKEYGIPCLYESTFANN